MKIRSVKMCYFNTRSLTCPVRQRIYSPAADYYSMSNIQGAGV